MRKSMNTKIQTPICIVGAGPAGATASLFLSKAGVKHVLLDKATFPRDKICGDALTLEAMHTLNMLDDKYVRSFKNDKRFLASWGLTASSPNGKMLLYASSGENTGQLLCGI